MLKIFFVYAENCEHCLEALDNIESAISKVKKIPCEIIKCRYDSREAVLLAINKGIDDLPGVVIGNKVFVKNCPEAEVIEAIKEA